MEKCPKCDKKLGKSGKCVPCRNKEILETCINYSKRIKNHTTAGEFEKSKLMKKVWKDSGLARIVNQILLVLNEEVKTGVYTKEVVDGKHYFVLVGIPEDEEEIEEVEEEDEEEPEEEIKEEEESDEEEIEEEEESDEEESDEEEVEEEEVEEEEESDEKESDEELAMKQYEQETGNKVMTTKGTIRKDYIAWKKNNWD